MGSPTAFFDALGTIRFVGMECSLQNSLTIAATLTEFRINLAEGGVGVGTPANCEEELEACGANFGDCLVELADVKAELESTVIGLQFVSDRLAERLAGPPANDADADGEPDAVDACPGTSPGSAVDSAGCSQNQFCGTISARSYYDRLRCSGADWRNDEHGEERPRDCRYTWRRRCEAQ